MNYGLHEVLIVKSASGGGGGSRRKLPELRKCGSGMGATLVLLLFLFGQCCGHYTFKEYSYVSLPKYVNFIKDVVDVVRN